MNENYGKLVINVFTLNNQKKLLGLNWKKENQEEQSSDSDEGLLIPGSSLKIQKRDLWRTKAQAPTVPPKDLETNLKSQHQFLMDVILKGNKMQYPSMDPSAMVNFYYSGWSKEAGQKRYLIKLHSLFIKLIKYYKL